MHDESVVGKLKGNFKEKNLAAIATEEDEYMGTLSGGRMMLNTMKEKWNRVPLTVKVSTSYAICSILQKCLSFITLPLFTRLLTTEQYGQYTVYSSWSGIFSIFLTLNLAYGSFQTAMVKYEDKRAEYITSVQGICLLLSCIFLMAYLPFRDIWNWLFELPTMLVLLMVSEIYFSTSTQLWMERNRFEFKYKSVVAVTLLSSILAPVFSFILVSMADEKGYARIIGYAGISIIIGFIVFILNSTRGKLFYNKEFWKYAFSFNIPLLSYYLSQFIFNQSDRIMISRMVGTGEAAMYGVAYSLAMILTFVLNAINGSYVPWMYRKIKEGRGEDNRLVSLVLIVLVGLIILCIIWFAPEIIMIIAGEKYTAATYVVAPVAMSLLLLFYCQLFINVEFYYEEKKMLVYGSVGTAVLNLVLNYLLIPIYGFVAAGYTTLVSYVVFALTNYYIMELILKKRKLPGHMYDYKMLVWLFVLFMAGGFLGVALYGNLAVRIVVVLLVLGLAFMNRSKFISALNDMRGK